MTQSKGSFRPQAAAIPTERASDAFADLRALAEKASPGPWYRDRLEPETIRTEFEGDIIVYEVQHFKDGAFIEAANPARVIALLDSHAALLRFAEGFDVFMASCWPDGIDGHEATLPRYDRALWRQCRAAIQSATGEG